MAKLLSYLFHPLFAPLYAAILIFNLPLYINYRYGPSYFNYIYVILIMNLILAPLLVSLYLRKIGMIESLEMKKVNERQIPYLISSIFYAFTYFLLAKINLPGTYLILFGASAIAVIVLFLLSLMQVKLSAHLTGLGGICGMLIVLSVHLAVDLSNWLMLALFLSGLVAAARFSLSAHKLWELLLGFILGMACQLLLIG